MIRYLVNAIKTRLDLLLFNFPVIFFLTEDTESFTANNYDNQVVFYVLSKQINREITGESNTEITFRFIIESKIYLKDQNYPEILDIIEGIAIALINLDLKFKNTLSVSDSGSDLNEDGRYRHQLDFSLAFNVNVECLESLDPSVNYSSVQMTVNPK